MDCFACRSTPFLKTSLALVMIVGFIDPIPADRANDTLKDVAYALIKVCSAQPLGQSREAHDLFRNGMPRSLFSGL